MIQRVALLTVLTLAVQGGGRVALEPETAPAPAVEPVLDPALLERFALGDFEARWVLWETELRTLTDARGAWIAMLAEDAHFNVLEWNALAHNDWAGTGLPLVSADAPQWPRLAVRLHASTDSHTWGGAKLALRDHPEVTLSWLEAWPEENVGVVRDLYDELASEEVGRVDTALYAPPLSDEALFGALEGDAAPVEFAGRERAVAGERYVHQVVRSIDVLTATSERDPRWVDALFRLATSPDASVRRAALVAWSTFAPEEVPVEDLLAIARDSGRDGATRAAALAGFSYGPDFRVQPELLSVAGDPLHPGWSVAVSRLGELGGLVAVRRLARLAAQNLEPARAELLDEALARARDLDPGTAAQLEKEVLRAAWARVTDHELAEEIERAVLAHLAGREWGAELRDELLGRIAAWTPPGRLDADRALAMRALAADHVDRLVD